eukprot:901435_1
MSQNDIIYVLLFMLITLKECFCGNCYKVDMTRIRILKTGGNEWDNKEEWDIPDKGFEIRFKSNFASREWPVSSGCTYKHIGSLKNNQGEACTPPTNTYDPSGFYDCYMEFPIIYLTEDQMNDGILVVVDGQVGDFDDQFDNGPIWDYEFRFQQWTAEEVRAGVKESYGTRNGPDGRRARHFYKYEYTDDGNCDFNINQFFHCDGYIY